jgi:hypothetical protein
MLAVLKRSKNPKKRRNIIIAVITAAAIIAGFSFLFFPGEAMIIMSLILIGTYISLLISHKLSHRNRCV